MIQKSREISIPSFIDGLKDKIILKELTFLKADELWGMRWSSTPPFLMLRETIESISNIPNNVLDKITIQDAISIIAFYRKTFYGDDEVATGYNVSDFIRPNKNKIDKKTRIDINGRGFTPYIPLSRAIQAEEYAVQTGLDIKYFILGAGAIELSAIDGGLHILQSPKTNQIREEIESYNSMISRIGNTSISLYNGVGTYDNKTKDDTRIKLLSVGRGGKELVALNFQSAFFFFLNAY